jgi:hypothetical protein
MDAVVHEPEALLVHRFIGRAGQHGRILLVIAAEQPPDAVTTESLTPLSDVTLIRDDR